MKRNEAWLTWAPAGARWSAWVKPVVFSFLPDPLPEHVANEVPAWTVALSSDTALVVELPGAAAVVAGIQLALCGYRPVPMFNACPFEWDGSDYDERFAPALVDVRSILRAVERYTSPLQSIQLDASAPPAFLLDANRSEGPLFPGAPMFDNRSIVRESDLPPGHALIEGGIRQVVLVRNGEKISRDLHPVLLAWQSSGLRLQAQRYGEAWAPQELTVRKRSIFRRFWDWAWRSLSFQTNSMGWFGKTIHPSAG